MLNTFATARIKVLVIDTTFLAQMWIEGHEQPHPTYVEKGIPADARLIHVGMQRNGITWGNQAFLIFEHPSWDEVPYEAEIPYADVVIRYTDAPDPAEA